MHHSLSYSPQHAGAAARAVYCDGAALSVPKCVDLVIVASRSTRLHCPDFLRSHLACASAQLEHVFALDISASLFDVHVLGNVASPSNPASGIIPGWGPPSC